MPSKKFNNESLNKLYIQAGVADEAGIPFGGVDNLQFISLINPYEFVFMDMKDFRSYRTEVDRKVKKKPDGTDDEMVWCIEVKPVNVMTTKYVPVPEKNYDNSFDYHGPLRSCLPG